MKYEEEQMAMKRKVPYGQAARGVSAFPSIRFFDRLTEERARSAQRIAFQRKNTYPIVGFKTMMKKRIASASVLLLCAWCRAATMEVMIDGVRYALQAGANTAVVIGYDEENPPTALEVGSIAYDGVEYSVVSVENKAFYLCKTLTSVSLPNATVQLGVSVATNENLTASVPSWGRVDIRTADIGVSDDGNRLLITFPVTTQSGFMVLQSSDARIVEYGLMLFRPCGFYILWLC